MQSARVIVMASVLLAGCNNQVSVQLATSGALDAQHVRLAISKVELTDDGGNLVSFDSADAGVHDLFAYDSGSTLTLVSGETLPQGHYVSLAITFDPDGAQIDPSSSPPNEPITVPASATVVPTDFTLARNDDASLRVNLDLRLSLSDQTASDGTWHLVPRLDAVEAGNSASLSGTIASTVRNSSACLQGATEPGRSSVYAYPVPNLVPYDESPGASPHPVGTVEVTWNADQTGSYRFPELKPGGYTIAVTCVATKDDPLANDNLPFASSASVTLDAGAAATLDLN